MKTKPRRAQTTIDLAALKAEMHCRITSGAMDAWLHRSGFYRTRHDIRARNGRKRRNSRGTERCTYPGCENKYRIMSGKSSTLCARHAYQDRVKAKRKKL